MKVRKQFKDVERGICTLLSDENCFVPEMSLPIEDILRQFSYVDNVRLADLARNGYEHADTNESDFDVEEFDTLDLAEREQLYSDALDVVNRYEAQMRHQKENPEETDTPDVDVP